MNKLKNWLEQYGYIVHPVSFALFPLLSFLSSNINETKSSGFDTNIFFVFNLIVGGGLWAVALAATRHRQRASLLTLSLIICFFTFGRLHGAFSGLSINVGLTILGPTKITALLCLAIVGVAFWFIKDLEKGKARKINYVLSLVSIAMVISTLPPILMNSMPGQNKVENKAPEITLNTDGINKDELPDIYYILLDGYARQDYLREIHNLDNSDFLDALKDRGFYVADNSNSNYPHTHLSVPSTLDMDYLQKLADQYGPDYNDRAPLLEVLKNNQTVPLFKQLGYKYVQVGSHWWWTNESDIDDIEVESDKYRTDPSLMGARLDEFAVVYLQTTAIKPLVTARAKDPIVKRILAAFERTRKVPDIDDPTLTFTHIVSPHPPYLFDKNGVIEGKTQVTVNNEGWDDSEAFTAQTLHINKLTLEMIDDIINKSAHPPIIIIASDHGPASGLNREKWEEADVGNMDKEAVSERMGILNAYLIPDGKGEHLYPEISPVNSFRYLLKHYFSQDIELLPDQSFFVDRNTNQYRFIDVTELVRD